MTARAEVCVRTVYEQAIAAYLAAIDVAPDLVEAYLTVPEYEALNDRDKAEMPLTLVAAHPPIAAATAGSGDASTTRATTLVPRSHGVVPSRSCPTMPGSSRLTAASCSDEPSRGGTRDLSPLNGHSPKRARGANGDGPVYWGGLRVGRAERAVAEAPDDPKIWALGQRCPAHEGREARAAEASIAIT